MSSPLLLRLSTALKAHGVAVNAVWDGIGQEESFYPRSGQEEGYPADLYAKDGRRVGYGRLDGGMVRDGRVVRDLEALQAEMDTDAEARGVRYAEGDMEIVVCTHGSRDCRCEQTGGSLVRALKEEIARRGVKGIRIGEVAHVGGHKYVYPLLYLHYEQHAH